MPLFLLKITPMKKNQFEPQMSSGWDEHSSAGEGLTRQWGCITLVQPVKALHFGEIQSEPKPQGRYNRHQIVYLRLAAT